LGRAVSPRTKRAFQDGGDDSGGIGDQARTDGLEHGGLASPTTFRPPNTSLGPRCAGITWVPSWLIRK